jgi:hypothetical protein
MDRRRLGMWISIVAGILIETAAAIDVNLASNKVPHLYSLDDLLLAGLVLLLGVTFLLRLRERRRPGPAREDHVRQRLINRAVSILGSMSSAVLDEAGLVLDSLALRRVTGENAQELLRNDAITAAARPRPA